MNACVSACVLHFLPWFELQLHWLCSGSTSAVAQQLNLPVVLVVDASGQAASLAAVVKGFRDHDPRLQFAGVVLNRVSSERHRELLSEVLASIDMPLLGCLPRHPELDLPSRHLGLAPAHELQRQELRRQHWAVLAEQHLDLQRLHALMTAPAAGDDGSRSGSPAPTFSQAEQLFPWLS